MMRCVPGDGLYRRPPVLGLSPVQDAVAYPSPVDALSATFVTAVACGWDTSFAVTGLFDALRGNFPLLCSHSPRPNPLQCRVMWRFRADGGCCDSPRFAFVFRWTMTADEGAVYSWGHGQHGSLGHGHTHDVPVPTLVASLYGRPVHAISSGFSHTVVAVGTSMVLHAMHPPVWYRCWFCATAWGRNGFDRGHTHFPMVSAVTSAKLVLED